METIISSQDSYKLLASDCDDYCYCDCDDCGCDYDSECSGDGTPCTQD